MILSSSGESQRGTKTTKPAERSAVFRRDGSSAVPELRTNLDSFPSNIIMAADGIGMRASQEARWKRNVKETRERQR